MAENSKIEWTTHTFNPWRGCTKVAEGCKFCYADTLSKRNPSTLGIWGPNGTRVVASEAMWREPVKWNETPLLACADCGQTSEGERIKGGDFTGRSWFFECQGCLGSKYKIIRPRVFCASLADVFEDWGKHIQVNDFTDLRICTDDGQWVRKNGAFTNVRLANLNDVRRRLFHLCKETPNLDKLLLTKRPENVRRMIDEAVGLDWWKEHCAPHCWLGTSIATQADADKNIPHLLNCRDLSPVLFVSAEPLLGPVDLTAVGDCDSVRLAGENRPLLRINALRGCTDPLCGLPGADELPKLDWVIAGGESGSHARPCHPDWVRSIRDQCQSAGVPFLFKQWGEWAPQKIAYRCGKRDSVDYGEFHRQNAESWVDDCLCESGTETMYRVGKNAAGRELDGREWNEYPAVRS